MIMHLPMQNTWMSYLSQKFIKQCILSKMYESTTKSENEI